MVDIPFIRVFYIPGGAGILPSTVCESEKTQAKHGQAFADNAGPSKGSRLCQKAKHRKPVCFHAQHHAQTVTANGDLFHSSTEIVVG